MSRRVSLRIRYDRQSGLVGLLALALLVAALLGYLAWGQGEVAASGPQAPLAQSSGLRGYYVTPGYSNGANALTACATGYHMASLWEILDPSNLKYNTGLGYTMDDSGQGPPTSLGIGWVRTGNDNFTSSSAGAGNCDAWTSSNSGHNGTYASLSSNWTAAHDIHVWEVDTQACGTALRVWCVEDKVSTPVYLPIILRNSS